MDLLGGWVEIFGGWMSIPSPWICTPDDFGLEASPCNVISELSPSLCKTSSEAGALLSEVRIENDSDQKNFKSTFFKFFLETTFDIDHVSCYPDI